VQSESRRQSNLCRPIRALIERKEIFILSAKWRQTNYRVPYKDTERMGVVHHGNYINWFEMAHADCMRHYTLPIATWKQKVSCFQSLVLNAIIKNLRRLMIVSLSI